MNLKLIKHPSKASWREELENIFANNENLDILKLGSYSSFINNTFLLSNEKQSLSKEYFIAVFNELIIDDVIFYLNIEDNISISKEYLKKIEFISDNINRFKNSEDMQTSTTFYLNNFIDIIDKVTSYEHTRYFENCTYDFCNYLNYFVKNERKELFFPIQNKKITEILRNIIYGGVNNKISSLAFFLAYSINTNINSDNKLYNLSKLEKKHQTEIIRYCISLNKVTNKNLNAFIIEYACKYKIEFEIELERFKAYLSSDCSEIRYYTKNIIINPNFTTNQIIKNLEPNFEQWKKLDDIYCKKNIKEFVKLTIGTKLDRIEKLPNMGTTLTQNNSRKKIT